MGTANNKQITINTRARALQTASRRQSTHRHGHCKQQADSNQNTGMGTADSKQTAINTRAWAVYTTNK